MVDIKLHIPIGSEDENQWAASWGIEEDAVFSLETFNRILEENPDEKDFRFNIHCDGGSVPEGLAIYDAIRTSGKNIYCNIEGGCHSMAICILLAAPKENRSANPNCRALIHKVSTMVWDSANADDLRKLADDIEREQNAIIDIYANRTGTEREVLENLMKEEKMRTAQELLDYGFISKINNYNTNQKKKPMNKTEILNKATNYLAKIKNLLDGTLMNYDFKDADGNVLFSTEKEDDSIAVGDAATPDGTFTLTDGRTVIIAKGKITEIQEKAAEGEENSNEAVETLAAENATLRSALAEAQNLINELKNSVESTYKPEGRAANRKPDAPAQKTAEELINESKQKRAIMLKGKENK